MNVTLNGISVIVDELRVRNNPVLTSISMMQLNYSKYSEIEYNPLLTSISLPQLATSHYINLTNNALNSNTINSLLNKFLTVLPSSGKYIQLNNQNPLASPTGQGIIDKQTLINTGNTVTTD